MRGRQRVLVVVAEPFAPVLVQIGWQGHGRCGYRRGPAGTSMRRRPSAQGRDVGGGQVGGQQVRHQLRPPRPGDRVGRVAGVGGGQDRLAACAGGGGLVGGEPVAQDGLGEPVHHQPALVDPGQRLPGQVGQGLPPGQRVSRPGGQLAGQFAGVAGEQVFGDRLGGQERAQAGQLGGGRVLDGRAGRRPAGSRRPATAGRAIRARPGPAAARPGSPAGPGTGRRACRSRP